MLDFFESLNRSLFLTFNGSADSSTWLVGGAVFFAKYTLYLIPLMLIAFWLWGNHEQRGTMLKSVLVVLTGLILSGLIGMLWAHPRPFVIGLGHQWIAHAATSSFPSNHMTIFTAIGLTLYLDGLRGWGLIMLLLGLAAAWARIFVGVHYPFDMIGAVVVVIIADAIVAPLWMRFGDSAIATSERLYRLVFARPISMGWVRR